MKESMALALCGALVLAGCGVAPRLIDKRVNRDWSVQFVGYSDMEIRDQVMPRFKDEFTVSTRSDVFKANQVQIRWTGNDIDLEEKLRKFFLQIGLETESVSANRASRICTVTRARTVTP